MQPRLRSIMFRIHRRCLLEILISWGSVLIAMGCVGLRIRWISWSSNDTFTQATHVVVQVILTKDLPWNERDCKHGVQWNAHERTRGFTAFSSGFSMRTMATHNSTCYATASAYTTCFALWTCTGNQCLSSSPLITRYEPPGHCCIYYTASWALSYWGTSSFTRVRFEFHAVTRVGRYAALNMLWRIVAP